jgi:hypothetical protein
MKQCKWARPCLHCPEDCCWVNDIYHGHCSVVQETDYCKRVEVTL